MTTPQVGSLGSSKMAATSTGPPRRTKIEKIEHLSSRQVTFSKRRKGLFGKAKEYSDRYGAKTAVIVFSSTKKLYEFSSTNMEDILTQYMEAHTADDSGMESLENKSQHEAPSSSSSDSSSAIGLLQEEIRTLNLDCSRLMGMELDGMSLRELNDLEKEIREGIESVLEKRKTEEHNCYQLPVYMHKDSPVYMLEGSNRMDANTSNLFSGTSSSGVSGCTESAEQSKEQFVDTSLRL